MKRIAGVLDGIDYHQFYFVAREDSVEVPQGAAKDEISPHTLLVPTDSGLCVSTGIVMGLIKLTIELLDAPPESIDHRERWEAVSDVSFQASSADARVFLLMGRPNAPFDAVRLTGGPGWYRARGHASGRSLDYDLVVNENPRETHLIQLWRADRFEPARHHRVDNQWADQGPVR
jgi:hypothetical protein